MKFVPKFIRHAYDKIYNIRVVKKSGFFDESWYVSQYPEVKLYKKTPIEHFLKLGYKMGYDPSVSFSVKLYEEAYPEVTGRGLNPLVHYIKEGQKKNYKIFPHCDVEALNKTWLQTANPLVTVIVPNYNHAPYLAQRLDSIYSQTYQNIQVILMDDKSMDESLEILRAYEAKYPNKTTLIPNATNSGSPFAQWKKGIEYAQGDYIWIAESDDWCDANFLEKTLSAFRDESVMLSFARSVFMKDGRQVWTMEEYLYDISDAKFMGSFTMPAHECVKKYFSKKNIIPNVSSCVFRKPTNLPLFEDIAWNRMKVCGDWVLYLHLIRGGFVAYNVGTNNYYRQHENNTSVSLHTKDRYYVEHQIVREYLAKLYKLTKEDDDWLINHLRNFWKSNRTDYSDIVFSSIFEESKMERLRIARLPNVAICGYAFSTGGGEKVPIDQANALVAKGVSVTFINCGSEPTNIKIRRKLNPCIPVINLNKNFNLINNLFVKMGIEVVHTHHASIDYAISLTKPDDVKHVVTLHGMYETVKHKYLKEQMPHLLRNVSQWLYIADKNLPVMEKYNADTSTFKKIFNAVPAAVIKKSKDAILKECGFANDPFVVAIASRALEKKGWKEARDSIEIARNKTHRNICIVFIGDGPLYDRMREQHEPWTHYTGYTDDVQSYFNASDMVLLPSTYEGESFPLCLLEAFQLAKPVVASNIGEIKRMMTIDDNIAGNIVDIREGKIATAELAEAIIDLICDKKKYDNAVSCACDISNRYSMDALSNSLIVVYRKLRE